VTSANCVTLAREDARISTFARRRGSLKLLVIDRKLIDSALGRVASLPLVPLVETLDKNASVITSLEPFSSSHGAPSAYPPDRSRVFFPSNINYQWTNTSLDATMACAHKLRQHTDQAHAAVLRTCGRAGSITGCELLYALFRTTLYGAHVPRLRAEIDHEDEGVMGLAGGFNVQVRSRYCSATRK
jgi:hypothetical protein